jgi:hypothetical protein
VHCVEITERLLAPDLNTDVEVDRHIAECAKCAYLARGVQRLDGVLRATIIVAPPLDLEQRLAQLAIDSARPQTEPWWRRLSQVNLSSWLAQRPQMVAAQGLAAVMLALASWQVFGWVSTFQPVLGDVGYAVELVAASPAVAYLGGVQLDLQSLGLWSVVGIVGWLVSEDGLIGRSLVSTRLRLP